MEKTLAALVLVSALMASSSIALAQKPLTKAEVNDLVASSTDSQHIAKAVLERGIDFVPTDAYLNSLRAKGAKQEVLNALRAADPTPLSKSKIMGFVKSGMPDKTLAAMVERRGINFRLLDDDLDNLRAAGGGDLVERALQNARQVIPPASSKSASESNEGKAIGNRSYHAGMDVTPPVATYEPKPSYSREARKAKISGAVTLSITVDTQGNVTEAHVVKPLGYGLDENALKTVKIWKFKPATSNGMPVVVRVTVEVAFAYDVEHLPAPQ